MAFFSRITSNFLMCFQAGEASAEAEKLQREATEKEALIAMEIKAHEHQEHKRKEKQLALASLEVSEHERMRKYGKHHLVYSDVTFIPIYENT